MGRGRFGIVFRDRPGRLAVKMLDPEGLPTPDKFMAEAYGVASLRHPNLLTLLGACPEGGCLVYEVRGRGLLANGFCTSVAVLADSVYCWFPTLFQGVSGLEVV